MFGISETELAIILIFAFMIFGPDKLPGMGRTIGRALRQFRDAQDSVTKVVQSEIVDPINSGMNEPAAKKRAEAAKAAQAEDADIDVPEGEDAAPVRRTETFAERKARLQAEKEAREAKAADAAQQEKFDQNDSDDEMDSVEGADSDEDIDAPTKAPEPQKPAKPSLADLYAMTPEDRKPAAEPADADSDADLPTSPESPATGKEE